MRIPCQIIRFDKNGVVVIGDKVSLGLDHCLAKRSSISNPKSTFNDGDRDISVRGRIGICFVGSVDQSSKVVDEVSQVGQVVACVGCVKGVAFTLKPNNSLPFVFCGVK